MPPYPRAPAVAACSLAFVIIGSLFGLSCWPRTTRMSGSSVLARAGPRMNGKFSPRLRVGIYLCVVNRGSQVCLPCSQICILERPLAPWGVGMDMAVDEATC